MNTAISGTGLGLRSEFFDDLIENRAAEIDFLEVAPENWIKIGGRRGKQFNYFAENFPIIFHGLSLSIGGPLPIDVQLIKDIKSFMLKHNIKIYSEHLSFCSDKKGHLYDLMPVPFTEESVKHIANRVKQVQDIMEQKIALENPSYYAAPGKEMSETDFINAVMNEAQCEMLLDVNNIYVNSVNHQYDAKAFLKALDKNIEISYIHIAGHYYKTEDLIIDSHGATIIDPVWELLELAYQRFGVRPTLLERDFNVPPLAELIEELNIIKTIQQRFKQSEKQYA